MESPNLIVSEVKTKELKELLKTESMLLLDIHIKGCEPCKYQKEIFKKNMKQLQDKFPQLKCVSMEANANYRYVKKEVNPEGFPQLVFIYKLKMYLMVCGYHEIEEIITFITDKIAEKK